jgi:hypothetical protein
MMFAPLPKGKPITQRFICNKVNKRLWVQDVVTGQLLYTPPDFIRLQSRDLIEELATRASMRNKLDIMDIMVFEGLAPRAPGYRKRPYDPTLKWYFLP